MHSQIDDNSYVVMTQEDFKIFCEIYYQVAFINTAEMIRPLVSFKEIIEVEPVYDECERVNLLTALRFLVKDINGKIHSDKTVRIENIREKYRTGGVEATISLWSE